MRLLFGKDPYVADWVAQRLPWLGEGGFAPCVAIGVLSETGLMAGGVVYHNYNPTFHSMEWSAAAETSGWLTPTIVDALLYYPFGQVGCRRLTAVIPASRKSSKPARALHRRLGFKREGTIRKAFGSEDAAIYGLLASEWRVSKFNRREAHGQEVAQSAASA